MSLCLADLRELHVPITALYALAQVTQLLLVVDPVEAAGRTVPNFGTV